MNDLYWEHFQHTTFQKDCSECYSEKRLINAKRTVCKIDKSCLGTPIGHERSQIDDPSWTNNPID